MTYQDMRDKVEALKFYGTGDECYENFSVICSAIGVCCEQGDWHVVEPLYEIANYMAMHSKQYYEEENPPTYLPDGKLVNDYRYLDITNGRF